VYLVAFFNRYYGLNSPLWVFYTYQIIGLDICFIGMVTICVAEFERKAKSLFVKAVVLLAADGLLYLLASWALIPPSSSLYAMNWSPFGYTLLGVPYIEVTLSLGLWALGFDFLYLGIVVTFIMSLGMILVSAGMTLTSSGRAFKGWIEKIHHVDTQRARAKYCRYCGSLNKDDAIFCDKCGKDIT
jgi:ribosomal protein L40E